MNKILSPIKKDFKNFEIKIPIFDIKLSIKFYDNLDIGRCGVVYSISDDGVVEMDLATDNLTYMTIVHESVHVASEVSKYIGLPINEDNDEFIAYITEYVFEKIVEGL